MTRRVKKQRQEPGPGVVQQFRALRQRSAAARTPEGRELLVRWELLQTNARALTSLGSSGADLFLALQRAALQGLMAGRTGGRL
jgi:hypothetical protein